MRFSFHFKILIAALYMFSGLPLRAQEPVFSIAPTEQCMAQGGWADCVGTAAGVCMDSVPEGYTTYGMNLCLDAERAWWDADLNVAYRQLIARETATDAELSDELVPALAEGAREMQRAWMKWRDATCSYEALQWYGGTGAGPATLGCQMRLTGQQALYLRSMLASG